MSLLKLNPLIFLAIGMLTFIGAVFEGITIGLLIPTMRGILEMDFGFLREFPVFKEIVRSFPGLFKTRNTALFIMLVGTIGLASVVKNVSLYFSSFLLCVQVRSFAHRLRCLTLERYLRFGKLFFDRANVGYLGALYTNVINTISNQLINLRSIITSIFLLIVYLFIMLSISWEITAFVAFLAPILYFVFKELIERIKKSSGLRMVSLKRLSEGAFNILSCIPLVKLYSSEEREKKKLFSISNNVRTWEISIDKKLQLMSPFQETVTILGILALISATALVVIKREIVDIAPFLIYFFILRRVAYQVMPINTFRATIASIRGQIAALSKIFDDEEKFFVEGGSEEFTGLKKSIELKNLTYSYIEELDTLHNVNAVIEKDKVTAIAGPSGAGKSTLVSLILRFYDCPPGSIFVDGADIRNFTLKSLVSKMAFVSQDTLLFNDTIRNNIAYGLDNISDEEIIEVTKKARLYAFIMRLPDGLDTLIGDRGVRLSGGEKQRLSIARALLKKADILILDEATSSLDTATEKLIQGAIEETIKGKTAIVIAHRLSTIKNADKILVIEDGRLVEEGPLNELLAKKGKFYKYWEEQKFY
jgi:subfamily B ATP-binding cassette protein MsbA